MSSMYGWESVTRAHLDDMQREAKSAPLLRGAAEAGTGRRGRPYLAKAGIALALGLALLAVVLLVVVVM
jgi:hypothetical protein